MVVFLAVGLAACGGSISDVKSAHDAGKGTERVYAASLDATWDATREAMHANHAGAVEEHRADGYMVATAGVSNGSWGASMGAWLSPVDPTHTRVRVFVSRAMATNIGGQTEAGILDAVRPK
jgi:hypothetical protein